FEIVAEVGLFLVHDAISLALTTLVIIGGIMEPAVPAHVGVEAALVAAFLTCVVTTGELRAALPAVAFVLGSHKGMISSGPFRSSRMPSSMARAAESTVL